MPTVTQSEQSPPALRALGRVEFTSLLAMTMALAALGIDLMLPAFGAIRADFGLQPDSTAVAGIVTAYLLGLAVAQLFYGPLADRFGRKPVLYIGFAIYILGAAASALAPSLGALYAARFVWGIGTAGPRVITLAVVRDTFSGARMARAMSLIMTVFIVVPVVAPSLGALIVAVADWRWVFGFCVLAALAVATWSLRLPETLRPEFRRDLRLSSLLQGGRAVLGNRQTLAATLAITALFGVFTSYLASSEIIINDVFGMGEQFPLVFGGFAVVLGGAMLVNAHVVGRVGVGRLVRLVLPVYVAVAALIVVMAVASGGHPPFWAFAPVLALLLAGHSLLIPNLNTLAMDPMAAVAGTASAVIGTLSTAGGATIGWLIDRSFDGTIIPISIGFLACGVVAMGLVYWAERGSNLRSTEDVQPEPSLP